MTEAPARTTTTTPDLLRHRAEVQPDGVAFVVDGTTELTYRDWDDRSDAVARRLVADGVGRGDRVGLLFGGMEWVEYAIGYFGALKAGATAVHLNADQDADELGRRIDVAGTSLLLHAGSGEAPAGFRGRLAAVGDLDSDPGGDPGPAAVDIRPEDIADLVFTSGTTGLAKAYTIPHGNAAFGRKIGSLGAFGEAAHMLTSLQIATGSSASALNIATIAQVTTVFAPPNDVERMAELIERYRTGMVAITPWVANELVTRRLHEAHDLSAVTMFASGSAPLPPARAEALLAAVPGARITSACSQSEASPALCINVYDPAMPFSVGKPTPTTELRVVDEDGVDLPVGSVGEIWLRHPAPKRLYLDLPEVNERLLADGWHRTGDLGRLDDEGFLHFFDRRADVIRTAGGPVSSLEVEATAYEHPDVVEAAAFAVGDGTDQRVAVAVVLADPRSRAGVEEHLATKPAAGSRPERVVVLDRLPRNSQNKVLKRELRATHG